MHLKFLHVFLQFDSLFPFSAESYSIVWMYHSWFMHLPIDGHLGCFQVWAIMNKATVNIHVQFLCGHSFQLIWVDTKDCTLNFARNHWTLFQTTILHFHQQ